MVNDLPAALFIFEIKPVYFRASYTQKKDMHEVHACLFNSIKNSYSDKLL